MNAVLRRPSAGRPGARDTRRYAVWCAAAALWAPCAAAPLHADGAAPSVPAERGPGLTAAAVEQAAVQAAVAAWSRDGLRLDVRVVPTPGGLRLPAEARGLALSPPALPSRPQARTRVWVDVQRAAGASVRVPVLLAVRAWREAPVAQASLRAGDDLRPGLVARAEVDVAASTVTPLPADAVLDGLRLRRPVAAGQPLSADALEPRPAVRRQQRVQVMVEAGDVRLRTAAVALRDGRIGETVPVRGGPGSAPYLAVVVADDAVRVEGR